MCGVWPDDVKMAHCIPLNQPGKPEYDREVKAGDIIVTMSEYAELQKHYRELLLQCGDRCQ